MTAKKTYRNVNKFKDLLRPRLKFMELAAVKSAEGEAPSADRLGSGVAQLVTSAEHLSTHGHRLTACDAELARATD